MSSRVLSSPGAHLASEVRRGRVLVLLSAVCFGTTGTARAIGAPDESPLLVGAARIVVGGLLLALLALAVRRHRRRMFTNATTRRRVPSSAHILRGGWSVAALGALGVAAYQPAFFSGVERTGVAVGTVVALGSAPVLTGLLQVVVFRRRPGRWWLVATALATAGVAVLAAGGAPGSTLDPVGVAAAVGAGASYAVYTLASKALLDRGWSGVSAMGAQFGGAAVLMLPVLLLAAVSDPASTEWLRTQRGILTALFLGVVPTALAYVLFALGLARVSAAETATLTLMEPVTAGLLGILLLDERVTGASAAGAGLLLAGLCVLVLSGRPRPGVRPQPARMPS